MNQILLMRYAAADALWLLELDRQFAGRAADVRFTRVARGASQTHLRRLYEARRLAKKALEKETQPCL